MIIGERVTLRALNKGDAQQILEWVNNPKLKYLTGTVYPVSEVEHEKWFENKLNDKFNKIFGIEECTNKSLIGVIGLNNTDLINRNTELYIYIGDESHWGKGLGTDAVKTLIRFIFEELNLHRVSLVVFSYNQRAINAYEKVGFVSEGIMRESLFKDGKYHDKILMALINDRKNSFL
ncbi:GNAT family N-acetyltransferase [Anaerobacillus alkalilacustris]|uniref:GNAT family N-acetyltransferase n=1 Tax=Anaerobacillus alkalilacustris TaxID=393763 RepID=UPI000A554CB3|nr:GNAT family protein [Anaerobacillus alkalilacustris]